MKKTGIAALIPALFALASCSTENLKQGLYEGIQDRNQALKSPQEKAMEPSSQSYRDYKKERDSLRTPPVAKE